MPDALTIALAGASGDPGFRIARAWRSITSCRPLSARRRRPPEGLAAHRPIQAGATPTNVQSVVGELQNSSMNKHREAIMKRLPQVMTWFEAYTLAPSIIAQNGSYKEG